MKVFIVFLALMFVNVNMMIFQNDLSVYRAVQNSLKETAEDCAYAASLYTDDVSYADGYLKFDCEAGIQYIEHRINEYRNKAGKIGISNISYNVYFFDEYGTCRIYINGAGSGEKNAISYPYDFVSLIGQNELITEPCVKVEISADTSNVFRHEFINANNTVRSSEYGARPY